MSTAFIELEDPYTLEYLSKQERELVDEVAQRESHTLAQAAVAMATAFLVYRLYMRRKVKQLMKDQEPTSQNLRIAVKVAFGMFSGSWVRLVAPHAVTGYVFGMRDVLMGRVEGGFSLGVG